MQALARDDDAGPERLASLFLDLIQAGSRARIIELLADATMSEVGPDGVAIVELLPDGGGRVEQARGAPELEGWRGEVEVIDAELGERLSAASAGRFGGACTLPMMSGGELFGAMVLLTRGPTALGVRALRTAEALVNLVAVQLAKEEQFAALGRSYAELHASRRVLEHTEKLRALGEMAAGVSHDLKNLLNPLSLHLQLLRRILKRGGEGAEEAIAEMEGVVRRGVETVERLRAFSRQSPERPIEVVDLDALAHEAMELSRPRIASQRRARGIRLAHERGGPPPIRARSSEVVTALLNLMVNSIDAMADGGTVTVSSGARNGGAWVRVTDDGPGIPPEIQAKIFEPFFTTKGEAGTGLGLAMVYACVRRGGGEVSLETAPGRGTSITLWFPAAAAGAQSP
jgi:signal transduction histidine kinase